MREVYYVGYYDDLKTKTRNRKIFPAANTKMEYIISVLQKNGYDLKILSASLPIDKGFSFCEIRKISKNTTLYHPAGFGKGGIIKKILNRVLLRIHLLKELLFKTNKNTEVIVYHSVSYMHTISFAKFIKKFNLTLEVNEVYGDVFNDKKMTRAEYKFFKIADKYLFPTKLLEQKINVNDKPYAINCGTYKIEKNRNVSFNDDKIHIVYAGTFEPRKGGATAVASAQYLSEKYHFHIIGFGNKYEVENIKRVVSETNKDAKATVPYDGLLSGEEYIEFLQKCHIGLSPQSPDASFNATSFPSKILSYMANGLKVVTVRIPAIEGSAIGSDVHYYDKQTPEEIAKAIMAVDLNEGIDSRVRIEELDKNFCEEIKKLIDRS